MQERETIKKELSKATDASNDAMRHWKDSCKSVSEIQDKLMKINSMITIEKI